MTKRALKLPPEFLERCRADNTTPTEVLTRFIADLCEPQSDDGSDERHLRAEEYYAQCGYPYRHRQRMPQSETIEWRCPICGAGWRWDRGSDTRLLAAAVEAHVAKHDRKTVSVR
jgi:hypothetical protein